MSTAQQPVINTLPPVLANRSGNQVTTVVNAANAHIKPAVTQCPAPLSLQTMAPSIIADNNNMTNGEINLEANLNDAKFETARAIYIYNRRI